jgi:predicted nucleic acid-binding protein
MSGSAIDTNVVIKMLRNDDAAICLLRRIERAYIPVIASGELFYGAYKSLRRQENMELFQIVFSDIRRSF